MIALLLSLSACAVDTSGLHPPMSDASAHDAGTCDELVYPLPDLPVHGQAVAWLDFDRIAAPRVKLCISFDAPNPASARMLHLGDDPNVRLDLGPCGPFPPYTRYEQCSIIDNTGRTLARLENTPFSAGCQIGILQDVQISVACP